MMAQLLTIRGVLHALDITIGDDELNGRWGVKGTDVFDLEKIKDLACRKEQEIFAFLEEEYKT